MRRRVRVLQQLRTVGRRHRAGRQRLFDLDRRRLHGGERHEHGDAARRRRRGAGEGANPSLTTAPMRQLLVDTGDYPDGTTAEQRMRRPTSGPATPTASPSRSSTPSAPPSGPPIRHEPTRRRVLTPADGSSVSGTVPLRRRHPTPAASRVSSSSPTASRWVGHDGAVHRDWDATCRRRRACSEGAAISGPVRPPARRDRDRYQPPGRLGRQLRRRGLRHRGLEPARRDLAALPAGVTFTIEQGARTARLAAAHRRRAGAPEPDRERAPGRRLVPRHRGPAAADVHRRLHRHAPPVRRRLGHHRPARDITVDDGSGHGPRASRPRSTPAPGSTSRSPSPPAARS